jgi:hypothetical protein
LKEVHKLVKTRSKNFVFAYETEAIY